MFSDTIILDDSMLDDAIDVVKTAKRMAADSEACRTARAVGVALKKGDKWAAGIALAANREARARSLAWAS